MSDEAMDGAAFANENANDDPSAAPSKGAVSNDGQDRAQAQAQAHDDAAPTPEIYGDFGFKEGEFDARTLDQFKGILAEAGLGREAGTAFGARLAALQQDHLARGREELSQRWLSETKNDPEFGGVRLKQTETRIAAAINAFGGSDAADIRALFNETGLGNHPALVRFFARAGRAVSEDGPINSGGKAYGGKSAAALLYPSMEGK